MLCATALWALFGASSSAAEFDHDVAQLIEITPPPETRINRANVDRYASIIEPRLAGFIRDDWLSLRVGELLSFRPHAAYVTATRQYAGQSRLGPPGVIENYQGGRPFPGPPDPGDPRAGEKLAWNMRLMYSGDSGRISEMHLQMRDFKRDTPNRSLVLEASMMRFMYRHVVPPLPSVNRNLQNALGAFYMRATSAGDLTGAEVLAFFNRDDTEPRNGWIYIPQLRRSQSLASFPPRETIFGSDILPDDFLGYSGRLVDMQWRYLGSTYALMPMYRHDRITVTETTASRSNYRFVHFNGRGSCFPNITWQLRHVHLLEARSVSEDNPVSRRTYYIDAQTGYPGIVTLFDETGDFWKLIINGVAHPNSHDRINHESAAPIFDSATTIDVQNERCTTVQLYLTVNVDGVRVGDFDPANLGGRGRRR